MSQLWRGVVSQGGDAPILFPIVQATQTSINGTAATSHTFTLPSGVTAGDLLIALWNGAANATYTAADLSGFTNLYNVTQGNLRARAAYRIATGSEGASVTAGFGSSSRFSGAMLRITRYTGVPIAGGAAGGTSASPNPASLTHGLGSNVVLWLAVAHSAAGGSISYPTNYGSGISAYTGVANNFHARTSVARRELEAASEDPGAFAIGSSLLWRASTIAIMGAAA